ncbi:MAG: hypothetical protein WDZ59_17310 [Pirellulales bacterium]
MFAPSARQAASGSLGILPKLNATTRSRTTQCRRVAPLAPRAAEKLPADQAAPMIQ